MQVKDLPAAEKVAAAIMSEEVRSSAKDRQTLELVQGLLQGDSLATWCARYNLTTYAIHRRVRAFQISIIRAIEYLLHLQEQQSNGIGQLLYGSLQQVRQNSEVKAYLLQVLAIQIPQSQKKPAIGPRELSPTELAQLIVAEAPSGSVLRAIPRLADLHALLGDETPARLARKAEIPTRQLNEEILTIIHALQDFTAKRDIAFTQSQDFLYMRAHARLRPYLRRLLSTLMRRLRAANKVPSDFAAGI